MVKRIALLTGCLWLSSCVSAPAPVPQPVPKAPVTEAPPAPKPAKPSGEWIDWPIEPGIWAYRTDDRGSIALFGPAGANATLTLRCDKARTKVFLSVAGRAASANFTIRTSSTLKSFAAVQASGEPPYIAVEIAPTDPILDAMAFSRGRFAIEVGSLRAMAIPNWGEVARVVEDCRG